MTTDPSQALAFLKALDEMAERAPWKAEWDMCGELSIVACGHHTNDLGQATYFTVCDVGAVGNWSDTTRLIASVRNVLPQLIGVVGAVQHMLEFEHYDHDVGDALTALAEAVAAEMRRPT